MDEFEIRDITDAMIIYKLLSEIAKYKVFIFITSNTKPIDLYKDGLQRSSFLPFIDFIGKNFDVTCLETNHDYRLDKLSRLNSRIMYPLNKESDLITRFINFVDNAYFHKVLLFATFEVAPQEIYTAGKRIDEFQRTVSRLCEMNSDAYPRGN